MKKVIIVLFVAFCLAGCSREPEQYEFSNSFDSIISIELIENPEQPEGYGIDEENFLVLRSLKEDEFSGFMNRVCSIRTKRVGTPPSANYGPFFARITYSNGDVDILGVWNFEFIEYGTVPNGVGGYQFAEEGFEELFFEYVNMTEPE